MMWVLGLLKSIPDALGLASKGIDYFLQKNNNDMQKALAAMTSYNAAIAAQKEVTLASMNHPVWWVLYAMFVVPTGIYYGKCVLWDTVLELGTTQPLRGDVKDWAGMIVSSIVGLQVGSSVIFGIVARIWKR